MSQYGLFMRTYQVHVHQDAFMPEYTEVDDAAAQIKTPEPVTLAPGERRQIRTGLHFKMPDVEFVQMLTPARNMIEKGILLFDTNRLIDTWDTDEIFVTLWNTTNEEVLINRGDVISKITVILNSHGSYVSADYEYITDKPIEINGFSIQENSETENWDFR